MAVKPITNKQVVNKSSVNRAEQRSFKNFKNRAQRKSVSQVPGNDFTKNYAIELKDVDTSIIGHVKNVISPIIKVGSEMIKVTTLYGNQERWVNARKQGYLKDQKGSIILPLIVLRRTDITKNTTTQQAFKHDVSNELVTVTRNSKWSSDNHYTRFSVQEGIHPVYENIVTGPADFVDISYDFILWTNYIEQMNSLTELFIEHNDTYWGSSEDYKFLCNIDSFSDASEMDAEGERIVKTTFSGIFKGYLLSETVSNAISDEKFQISRHPTPHRVVFGMETSVSIPIGTGATSKQANYSSNNQNTKTQGSTKTPAGTKSTLGATVGTSTSPGPTGQL